MDLFSRLRPSSLHVLLPVLWALHKIYLPVTESDQRTHIANKLEDFANRQQLAIELLPPGLTIVGIICRRLGLAITSLRLSGIVGEGLELSAVQCLLIALSTGNHYSWMLLGDAFVAVAAIFTTDYTSLFVVFLACKVMQMTQAFQEISNVKKSMRSILGRLVLVLTASTLCQLAFVSVGFSLGLGASEVAYGGNYNLRYLDPEARRAMRPGFEMPSSFKDPGPGLHSMTPYSLYIPFAGFLWSDHLAWNPETGDFDDEDGSAPRRVVMKDPVGRFAPWILQKDLGHSFNNGLEQDLLVNREPVVIRSVQSKQFLRVASDPAYLELQDYDDDATEATYSRFVVNMDPVYDEEMVFEVRSIAEGFRLFHPGRGCYLATTFRSFASHSAMRLNDSMLHELQSELEVSCVQLANQQASTFYIIEGYHERSNQDLKGLPPSIDKSSVVRQLRRGIALMYTMRQLYIFRRKYHALQAVPTELIERGDVHDAGQNHPVLSVLTSGLLPVMGLAGLACYKQRNKQSMKFWPSQKGQKLLSLFSIIIVHRFGDGGSGYIHCSRCVILLISGIW